MPRGEFDRTERRARTRARLLEAAARVYARRGFDAATLDEVAEEAGFTKGAVYDHFGSKEKLLFALLDEHVRTQIAEQVSLFDSARETASRPRVGADRWMAGIDADPDAFRLFVEAWVRAQRDEELREWVAGGVEEWRAMLKDFGEARGGIEGEVTEQLSTALVALGTGLAMLRLVDPEAAPPRLLGAVSALVIGALESSPEARALLADVYFARP
jgi:AcrR family transcriptional regulator